MSEPLPISNRIRRIQKEIKLLFEENLENEDIYFHVKDEDLSKVWVVITGTEGTPYAYCPFFFEFEFPELYPMEPPKCKFCTGDGKTRLNPNLYVEGKVCLSILHHIFGFYTEEVQKLGNIHSGSASAFKELGNDFNRS